ESWVEAARIDPPPGVMRDFGKQIVQNVAHLLVYAGLDAVHAFELERGSWRFRNSLKPAVHSTNWRFGSRMAVAQEWLFIAAPYDDSIVAGGGSVYAYRFDAVEGWVRSRYSR
ncbi:hypothetical protein, partial [Adonisia turfae]